MSRDRQVGIGVGSTSLITVFVVLCLIAFAALSLLTARNDLSLAQTGARATSEYYTAESLAEQQVAAIATAIRADAPLPAAVASSGDGHIVFDVPINAIKTLRYTVAIDGDTVAVQQRQVIVEP